MKRKILSGLLAVSLIFVLTACNKAPQIEMDAAKTAILETQAAGADVYLPEDYAALNDTMNRVLLGIESKKSKWFAGYNDEKAQLNSIVEQAGLLRQNTEVRKNEVKEEIMSSLTSIKTLLDENQQLLSQAPKGKEGTAVLLTIKEEISVLNASVEDIMKMVEAGNYLNAQSKASVVNDKTLAINAELKEAIAKYNARRR